MNITAKIVVDQDSREVLVTGWSHIPEHSDVLQAALLVEAFMELLGRKKISILKFHHHYHDVYGVVFKYQVAPM